MHWLTGPARKQERGWSSGVAAARDTCSIPKLFQQVSLQLAAACAGGSAAQMRLVPCSSQHTGTFLAQNCTLDSISGAPLKCCKNSVLSWSPFF